MRCRTTARAVFSPRLNAPHWIMTELTRDKKVNPDTFARMARHYSEREICEIVWLAASERIFTTSRTSV